VAQHRRSWPDGPACEVLIVVVVLLWLVNRFIAHAFTATIILISASFCPSTVRVNTETVYSDRREDPSRLWLLTTKAREKGADVVMQSLRWDAA